MMRETDFVWHQDGPMFIGWLAEFPAYRTQGESLVELRENLADLEQDLRSGEIPGVCRASRDTSLRGTHNNSD